jgi:ABC-2 type transport system permease protein
MVAKMINITLLKKEIKSNIWLIVTFVAIIVLYGTMITAMYSPDPAAGSLFAEMEAQFPELFALLNFNVDNFTNYAAFISGYLFGFIFIMFPLIFAIILVNKVVFRYIDKGSMAYLLTTPNSRKKIIVTEVVFIALTMLFLGLIMYLTIAVTAESNAPGKLNHGAILYVLGQWFFFLMLLSGLTFVSSTTFEGKLASGLNVGVPAVFFVFSMIGNLPDYDFFRFLTPFSLFNADEAIAFSNTSIWNLLALIILSVSLYGIGIRNFTKRDLSI